jgi:hypothetical protein
MTRNIDLDIPNIRRSWCESLQRLFLTNQEPRWLNHINSATHGSAAPG